MRNSTKQAGPVTLAIQAMRKDEMAEALADISSLAADASDSVVAILNAARGGQLIRAIEEGVAATEDLRLLALRTQAALLHLETA